MSHLKVITNIASKLKNDPYFLWIFIVSLVFSILFTVYSSMAFNLVEMTGWDMGIYMQALSSGISGHLFYSALVPGSYLAEHFSPILFILLIPYYLFPSAYTLIVLQSFAIGFSTLVLYLLSKEILQRIGIIKAGKWLNASTISFIISMAYIMSPLTESPVFFDFHLMVFLPLFFFLAIYSFIKKKYILNIIFLALIVSIHSTFVSIALMAILFEIFLNRTFMITSNHSVVRGSIYFFISLAILVPYFIFAGILKGDIAGVPVSVLSIHVSGSVGPTTLVIDTFTNPVLVLHLLVQNYILKLTLLFFAFGGFAFLFIRYPASILTFVPYIIYSMFSTYPSYYTIGYQYTMIFIPMVAVSGVVGMYILVKSQMHRPSFKLQLRMALSVIIIIAILGFSIATPIVSGDANSNSIYTSATHYGNDTYMNQVIFEHEIANSIPKNATLVTGNGLFPLFGNDLNATAFPYTTDVIIKGDYYQYLVENQNSIWSSEPTHISGTNISLNMLEHEYMASGNYTVYAHNYGIIVLKRN
ncbi:external multipass membrane protein [Ferroplasma acidiphilum]|uniref:External multipass membrane protein n=1 Tax=Ferroplasma acidiphilum TaxID=74969 RepID=A0A1V0N3X3_9ARCH|nr:DUF2079 domain-containing protein [Ferroplasma acidiphilum]ARD84804.1 external multipass membrane protein [Ferroplasma acidiphilum]